MSPTSFILRDAAKRPFLRMRYTALLRNKLMFEKDQLAARRILVTGGSSGSSDAQWEAQRTTRPKS
jgi:hypothetical protein